jgi:fumarate hydratase class I
MRELTQDLVELIRLTACDLPSPVEARLRAALQNEEPGSAAQTALAAILKNIEISRQNSTPICQDTGTPAFYIKYPAGLDIQELKKQILSAVENATQCAYLRPNAVDPLSGINSGNNLGGDFFPDLHFQISEQGDFSIDLLLKGGGCENVGRQYSLPDETLSANRDLEGVRQCALDAVYQAQGFGCSPGFLGIAIGGDRGTSYLAAKETFLQDPNIHHSDEKIAALEERITSEANELGIGPMGFGGVSTLLGTRIKTAFRLPASYFVSISYMCWAYRHRKMTILEDHVIYE